MSDSQANDLGGPFRELFVEVAEALLAGAVEQATQPPPQSYVSLAPSLSSYLDALVQWSPQHVTVFCERSPISREVIFAVRCKRCRKTVEFTKGDEFLVAADNLGDAMRDVLDRIEALAEMHTGCK